VCLLFYFPTSIHDHRCASHDPLLVMVRFFENSFSYDYPLPAVSLAYFLRYPNPYATHVISTDVISRHVDPITRRLHTTRLVLKQSRLPKAITSIIPSSILGVAARGANGETQNYIMEKSVVDLKEGWMETETQNLQFRGILSVVERQLYFRPDGAAKSSSSGLIDASQDKTTGVTTNVTFRSRFSLKWRDEATGDADIPERKSFFSSWSSSAIQRTIESASMSRTSGALAKSKEGMNIVLERIRTGGIIAALEGMRRDRELVNLPK